MKAQKFIDKAVDRIEALYRFLCDRLDIIFSCLEAIGYLMFLSACISYACFHVKGMFYILTAAAFIPLSLSSIYHSTKRWIRYLHYGFCISAICWLQGEAMQVNSDPFIGYKILSPFLLAFIIFYEYRKNRRKMKQ